MSKLILNYPLFDGERVIESASVVIEDGRIAAVNEAQSVDSRYFLMPGLIDAHTHINAEDQVHAMLKSGVTAACDVAASSTLVQRANRSQSFPLPGWQWL